MKIVGITGGIGSGKSTVVKMFEKLEVPVYVADAKAKALMNDSDELKTKIIKLLGKNAYKDKIPNRRFIADQIFNDKSKLKKFNAIVHPAVHDDFDKWLEQVRRTDTVYCIYEAAILFEVERQELCDMVILVTAPRTERIDRVMKRDNISSNEVIERMEHQWADERKKKLADFTIENIDLDETEEQVNRMHSYILNSWDHA